MEVFPLSFIEYCQFKNIKQDFYASKNIAKIKNTLTQYLTDGGFPELLFIPKEYKIQVLQEYYNVLIYKDIVERYNIKNTVALKYFLKRILSSTTKQISVNKIFNELKSAGIKIGKNSLYNFLDYCQNIYLLLILTKYDKSLVNKELAEKKVYSIDLGFNNAIEFNFSSNYGKALENAVYLQLKRQKHTTSYYKSTKSECDFITFDRGKAVNAIQVSYKMDEESTKKREIKGLVEACQHFNLKSGTIVTFEDEEIITHHNITVHVVPFYKWVKHANEY